MWWVVGAVMAWFVCAFGVALVFGATVRLADRRAGSRPDDVPAAVTSAAVHPVRSVQAAPAARRRFDFPGLGVALVALATGVTVTGYAVSAAGANGQVARALSMDAPFSLQRMFVATLFAAAALAAIAGARSGRRTWWTAVGVVATLIAAMKIGGAVDAEHLRDAEQLLAPVEALVLKGTVAAVAVLALALLSRGERRDRRRVLSALALYALASVGLSGLSYLAGTRGGAGMAAAATLVEQTGEAWAAVVFLLAVLLGVAPRLVLPRTWVLQREADRAALDVPENLRPRLVREDPAAG